MTIPNMETLPYVEFAAHGGNFPNTIGVDFTANGLVFGAKPNLGDKTLSVGAYTVTLVAQTPGAFDGLELANETDFLPNGMSWTLLGDTITISAPTSSSNQFRSLNLAFAVQPVPTEVPEPASLALFAAGLLGLALRRRRTACPSVRAATS